MAYRISFKDAGIILFFLAAYCVQPLLVDIIKFNGGAHSSTFLFLIPHYYSMVLVGLIPSEKRLLECDWKKGAAVSVLDIVNQLLKKAGLVFAGAAVYIVIDSSSIVWTAIWSVLLLKHRLSFLQWLARFLISGGIALKACVLNFSFSDDEFIGVALILLASILMGLTFVLNEKFMNGGNAIPGPILVCMMGIFCSVVLSLWTTVWTIPQIDRLVIQQVKKSQGSYQVIFRCFVFLFISGWIHSGTLWYLIKNVGAVSSGVLKGLKVALVFVVSHFLFCELQPSQCLNVHSTCSAVVCVAGVMLYSYATSKVRKDLKGQDLSQEVSIEDKRVL